MEKFENTKVLILAAGFGKRLRPLTDTIPKPLITAGSQTILALILEKVLKTGFDQSQIVINTHYLAEKISDFVKKNYPKVNISYEPEIRGTGGALFGAKEHLRGHDVLIHNADILSDESLDRFLHFVVNDDCDAAMMIREDSEAEKYGLISVDDKGQIIDISGILGSNVKSKYMFTGIHYIRNSFWKVMDECDYCSIIDNFYIPALKNERKISAFISNAYWNDIGDLKRLEEARHHLNLSSV